MISQLAEQDYLDAFRARRAYCDALLQLSRQQSGLIAADDYTQLLELLAHKQQLIDAWVQSNGRQQMAWQSWPQQRSRLEVAARTTCEELLEECRTLMADLMAEETCSTRELTMRKELAEQSLSAVCGGQQAAGAYAEIGEPVRSLLNLDR